VTRLLTRSGYYGGGFDEHDARGRTRERGIAEHDAEPATVGARTVHVVAVPHLALAQAAVTLGYVVGRHDLAVHPMPERFHPVER